MPTTSSSPARATRGAALIERAVSEMTHIKLGIAGATGWTGSAIAEGVLAAPDRNGR